MVFLRRLAPGGASRSYGIQVGRLAGLPGPVVERAREILANLEGGELDEAGRPRLAQHASGDAPAPADGFFTVPKTRRPEIVSPPSLSAVIS